jgi:hypothetical protein
LCACSCCPSIDELRRRLTGRGTDSAEVITARMERARAEIRRWDGCRSVVVNDDIEECFAKVREILHAERMKRARQTGLIGFVRGCNAALKALSPSGLPENSAVRNPEAREQESRTWRSAGQPLLGYAQTGEDFESPRETGGNGDWR